ncbi:thiol:disulfide interchange protein DsbA/DsbL [Ramlibacter sp. XY19]|uniref:thiol:disulfide interchange protein DsbA/DsbL n=1 Tax=Ramlibacter paludis TaxID=2908000 RepID=UPI0023DA2DDC|nr:thiol:disulfide interchange protein DsbA/DsbL [Ramlibacter paludis]MCG2595755.1 thiol:disulfide interchange protein DsbA/DsbL [Ramlibacter paludis]
MNRREFSAATAASLGALALGMPGLALAQQRFEAGRDFRAIDKPVPVDTPAPKIEVVEFFWYSCPHCNAFEPKLVAWSKKLPPDVVLKRVPIAFRDDFVPQQRLYYTLEAMGKLDELHQKVFDAVHRERKPTNREEAILEFAQANGLDVAKFKELYNSFSISAKARRATQLQNAYQVEGVPALGVAGKYYIDGEVSKGMDRGLLVADYLIGEARKAK